MLWINGNAKPNTARVREMGEGGEKGHIGNPALIPVDVVAVNLEINVSNDDRWIDN